VGTLGATTATLGAAPPEIPFDTPCGAPDAISGVPVVADEPLPPPRPPPTAPAPAVFPAPDCPPPTAPAPGLLPAPDCPAPAGAGDGCARSAAIRWPRMAGSGPLGTVDRLVTNTRDPPALGTGWAAPAGAADAPGATCELPNTSTGASNIRAQVPTSISPVGSMAWRRWKSSTAPRVSGPKSPSTARCENGSTSFRRRWAAATRPPWLPTSRTTRALSVSAIRFRRLFAPAAPDAPRPPLAAATAVGST
jgi:hypothetical protein